MPQRPTLSRDDAHALTSVSLLRLWDLIRGQRDQIRRQREQIEWFEWECESLSMLLEFRDHASAQGIRGWVFQDAPIRCRPQDIPDLRAALAIAEARDHADASAFHRAYQAEIPVRAAEVDFSIDQTFSSPGRGFAEQLHEAAMGWAAECDAAFEEASARGDAAYMAWHQDTIGEYFQQRPGHITGGTPGPMSDSREDWAAGPPLSDLTESDENNIQDDGAGRTSARAYSDH